MAADGEGAAHKGVKKAVKRGKGGAKEGQKKGQWQSKKKNLSNSGDL